MKLSPSQIETIDVFLYKNNVKYIDIKLELLDHIASQIEYEMKTTKKTFPDAYNQVFDNWSEEFKLTRDFFSIKSTYPKLVHSKLKKQLQYFR